MVDGQDMVLLVPNSMHVVQKLKQDAPSLPPYGRSGWCYLYRTYSPIYHIEYVIVVAINISIIYV